MNDPKNESVKILQELAVRISEIGRDYDHSNWTVFRDMHSGGNKKLAWDKIYIEAPEEEARRVFINRFGRSPENVTCECCGEDYSVSSNESLRFLTAFYRGCPYGNGAYLERQDQEHHFIVYQTLEEYLKNPRVLFIFAEQIKLNERRNCT